MKEQVISYEVMASYREFLLLEEKSDATIDKYMRDAGFFEKFMDGKALSKENVLAYKQHLMNSGYAASSVNSMLAAVNSLLDFMGLGEYKVKNLKIQKRIYSSEDKELSKAEFMRLMRACGKNTRLKMVMQTICACGIRVSELRYFTVESVRTGIVEIRMKGKNRTVLIPGELKKMLLEYAGKKKICSGIIFAGKNGNVLNRSYIWAMMKKLCDAAGVLRSKVFPHNLRKLFARTFYSAQKDIAKLADILGHSSIDTTRIYIMQTGREHLAEIEKLGLIVI